MNTTEYALTGSITILNIFLHILGSYLLWKTYNWTTITTQQLIIFHLSVCEAFESANGVIHHIFAFLGYELESPQMSYGFCFYIAFAQVLYMLMMVITLDRLMAVVLGLKYPLYWTVEKTKKLLKVF